MVRTRNPQQNNDDAAHGKQSQTQLETILAQAKVVSADASVAKDSTCLTCVRSTSQKYCYDSKTGAGQCCPMNDIDSKGCN